jgi:hypothetical protein
MAGYIGREPLSEAVQSRAKYTVALADSPKTTFPTAYQPGYVDVYLNGIHLEDTTDYVASSGSDIVLTLGATTGQVLEIIALTNFTLHGGKDNYAATGAPGVGDDSADGYRVGSLWVDTTNDLAYTCVDETVNAAVWSIAGASAVLPFYKANGTSDTIAITSRQLPFYKADGTPDNIGV